MILHPEKDPIRWERNNGTFFYVSNEIENFIMKSNTDISIKFEQRQNNPPAYKSLVVDGQNQLTWLEYCNKFFYNKEQVYIAFCGYHEQKGKKLLTLKRVSKNNVMERTPLYILTEKPLDIDIILDTDGNGLYIVFRLEMLENRCKALLAEPSWDFCHLNSIYLGDLIAQNFLMDKFDTKTLMNYASIISKAEKLFSKCATDSGAEIPEKESAYQKGIEILSKIPLKF
jgi:hypothetical protein